MVKEAVAREQPWCSIQGRPEFRMVEVKMAL
jgi:hypothetical protein